MTTTTVTVNTEAAPPKQDTAAAEQRKAEAAHREGSAKVLKERRAKMAEAAPKSEPAPAGEPEAKSEPKRDDGGKFAKADDAAAADAAKPDADKPAEPKYDQAKYEAAMKALALDGTFSPEELATLPPDVVIAKGEKAKKRQSDVDREYKLGKDARGELETLKAKLAEVEAAKANPATGTKDATGKSATALESSVQALTSKIKESLGDDIDLQGEFDALTQQLLAAAKPDLSAVDALRSQFEGMIERQSRPDLSKQFPELKDEAAWQATKTKASALVKSALAPDYESGLKMAAAMDHGLAAADRATQKAKEIDKAKQHGQPYSGRQANESTSAKPENAEKATLRELRRQYANEAKQPHTRISGEASG